MTEVPSTSLFRRVVDGVVLPPEVTAFERQYLARMNRVALYFYWAHLPIFVLIAAINGTGPLTAAILTACVLIGPTVASRVLESPRAVSVVHGFTAMLMGGVLVHLGQGPVQIEMHFYFFVLLALLAVFANPLVIVVAAVTAAVHHLLLWIWLPSSVFNYDAPLWVVAVHAAFVVLESVAASFIARSFFDNVIGLERIVAQRTAALDVRNQDLRRVLDHLGQGLVIVRADGRPTEERSRATERMLGPAQPTFAAWVAQGDASCGAMMELGLAQVFEEVLPPDITLGQLPADAKVGEQVLAFDYTAIGEAPVEGVLVMISDVTAERARAALEAEQKELMSLVDHALRDRRGVAEFLAEGTERVQLLAPSAQCPPELVRREVHTLKGNAGIFGLPSIAELCHRLETAMAQAPDEVPPLADQLSRRWARLCEQLQPLLERDAEDHIEVDRETYERHLRSLRTGSTDELLVRDVLRWPCEPVKNRLDRLGEQAVQIARRLGRAVPELTVEHDGLRLDPSRWSGFWASLVHVVRNAVDHGLEPRDVRLAAGKAAEGRVSLRCARAGTGFEIVLADDGAGIDWARVAAKAKARGLPHQTHDELVDALCADGFSTRDDVSETSGRGVGMAAVRAAVAARGGVLRIESTPGRGTRVVMQFPSTERVTLQPLAAA